MSAHSAGYVAKKWILCSFFLLKPQAIGQISRNAVDVLTHHNDNSRSGANLNETVLDKLAVASGRFGKLAYRIVDGNIYAQPLIASQVRVRSRRDPVNLAIVATEHNSLYAFDADDGEQASTTAEVWHTDMKAFGKPVDSFALYSSLGAPSCTDLTPEVGITGTPAIMMTQKDGTRDGVVFAAAKSLAVDQYRYSLFALDLASGKTLGSTLIRGEVKGKGIGSVNGRIRFDARLQLNRPGLLLAGSTLYVTFGGHCDEGDYHGWVFAYDVSDPKSPKRIAILCTTPNGNGPKFDDKVVEGRAGIWMSGEGPAADEAGNVYVSTGNGSNDRHTEFGDSVLRLNGRTLKPEDWFAPQNEESLKNYDWDLGATGPLLIPGTQLLIAAGKEGVMYRIDRSNMGKGVDAALQSLQVTHPHPVPPLAYNIHGTPAVWVRRNEIYLYVTGEEDPVKQYRLTREATATGSDWKFDPPAPLHRSAVSAPFPNSPEGLFDAERKKDVWMPGGFLSLSAHGDEEGSGILWVTMPYSDNANRRIVRGVLRAFDASDVSKPELWDSESTGSESDRLGQFAKYVPPTVANGKVYVATFQQELVLPDSPKGTPARATHFKDESPGADKPALVIYGLKSR